MLSRGTSSASARIRRTKSSSSVRPRPLGLETVDPEVSRQYALTAASLAFERANQRTFDITSSMDTSSTHMAIGVTSFENQRLQRRQSVRFTGPSAISTRQHPMTRREAMIYPDSKEDLQPSKSILKHKGSSISRPDSVATVLPQFSENDTETRVSTPSSYRKLKKAKSMFHARKAPSTTIDGRTPNSEKANHYSRLSNSEDQQAQNAFHARSSSLPSGGPDYMLRTFHPNPNQDAAIQMARDQYLRQLEEQRLKERPSFLNLRRLGRPEKPFRRTVRTSSTNSYGSAIASPLPPVPLKGKKIRHKARDISVSLGHRLMRVFRKPSASDNPIPTQQLDASRPHFRDYEATASVNDQGQNEIPHPDEELLYRVDSRESSSHKLPIHLDRAGHAGSIRSMRSADSKVGGKSRVTSWTNSTTANTMTTQQLNEAYLREKKRLSIIQENGGPHQPSSSMSRAGRSQNGYAIFRKPLRNDSTSGRRSGQVDSQRVYSALQRRLDANKENSNGDLKMMQAQTDLQQQLLKNAPGSIRRVAPSIKMPFDSSQESLSSTSKYRQSHPVIFSSLPAGGSDDVFHPPLTSARSGVHRELTPQQIAEYNERTERQRKKGPLREVKSAFFPPTTHFHATNASPYRRAMLSSTDEEPTTDADAESMQKKPRRLTPLPFPNRPQSRLASGTESGSVYSRSMGGQTPKPSETSLSLVQSENVGEPGTAVIFRDRPGHFDPTIAPVARRRNSSVGSSGEWKGWMASQVANLANRSTSFRVHDEYPDIGHGHRRENAQINSDDVQIKAHPTSSQVIQQPLANLQINVAQGPALCHKVSDTMVERFPMIEKKSPSVANTTEQRLSVSTSVPGLPNQKRINLENQRFSSSQIQVKPESVSQKPSRTSLRSRNSFNIASTPLRDSTNVSTSQSTEASGLTGSRNKLHSTSTSNVQTHHSPERAARLRRMKSANIIEPRAVPRYQHHQQEKQAINDPSPAASLSESYDTVSTGLLGPLATDSQATGSQKMIEQFLRERGKTVNMSEGSGASPAFL